MKTMLLVLAGVAIVLGLLGCPPREQSAANTPLEPAQAQKAANTFSEGVTQVDEFAPDFGLTDIAGGELTKADYSGKVLILDFWATWCGTCVEKLKKYEPIIAKYKEQGVELVAVTLDSTAEVAAGWAKKTNCPYRIAMFDDTFKAAYFPDVSGSLTIPVALLIDRDGNLRFRFSPASTVQDMELAISQLVRDKVGGDQEMTNEVVGGIDQNAEGPEGAPAPGPVAPAAPAKAPKATGGAK